MIAVIENDSIQSHTPPSSPAHAGDPVRRALSSKSQVSGILDRPPPRAMTTEFASLLRFRDDGERRYGVSTARPTSLPFCRSTSASLALLSGKVVTGIGAIFPVR